MDFDGFLESIDTIFYGRISYDAWGNFQPAFDASSTEQTLWRAVHSKNKYVFSRQSRQDDKAVFISADFANEVARIKEQDGKDIWLYGGASLIKTFADLNLIDVFRLSVHPVILGKGKPLIENPTARIPLKLVDTRTFRSGVVQLVYEVS